MGKGDTTQTTTSEPPAWAKPLFTQSASETQRIYDTFDGKVDSGLKDADGEIIYNKVKPIGFNSWSGDTTVNPSQATEAGIQGLLQTSNQGASLGQNPMNLTNKMLETGGLSQNARQGIGSLYNTGQTGGLSQGARQGIGSLYDTGQTGGLSQDARQGIWSLYNMGQTGTANPGSNKLGAAEKYYTDMAQGDMLNGNPFFNAALNNQTDRIKDQVNLGMSSAGRYGSGAHTGTLTDALSEARIGALNENFGRERGYQMQAIQGLMGDEQNKFANRLSAIQSGAGLEQQAAHTGMQAIQSGAGLEQQGAHTGMQAIQSGAGLEQQGAQTGLGYINALPTVQQNRVFDDNLKLQAGGMQEQSRQADLNDQIRRFTENDMEQITRLGFLQSAGSGTAGPYGTTKSISQQPFNPMSLLSMFGLFG